MVSRLPPRTENGRDHRAELDSELGVIGWRTPGRPAMRYEREPGAPSWWHGDEEASQSFLAAQGVKL